MLPSLPSNSFTRQTAFAALEFRRAVLTVRLAGPTIGQREAPIIAADIAAAIDSIGRSFRAVVLDLSGVQVLTSMGLGMCIDARHRATAAGAGTIIFGASPALIELLRMMKVDRLCTIARDARDLTRAVAA